MLGSLRVFFWWYNKRQNLISVRKINFTRDQQSSMDHSMLKNGDLPPVYIASRIRNITKGLKELNNKIVVKELNIPDILSPDMPESEIQDVEVLICDVAILSANYHKMPLLKWAHCTWAGVEPLFKAITFKPSFIVTRHFHENMCTEMAEYVLTHVLMVEKNFFEIRDFQKEKKWEIMYACTYWERNNRNLNEITLGILGVGNMGQAIAKCFKNHGTHLIGLAKSPKETSEFGYFDKITVSLREILSEADYVVNTLPSTPETVGLLDGDVLQFCKKGAVFINVGRGDIVHEDTLLKALENRWLHHLVLDVFQEEPLPENSRLWTCNKLTMTPHCAAKSVGKNIAGDFMDSFSNFLQNKPLKHTVDWEKHY